MLRRDFYIDRVTHEIFERQCGRQKSGQGLLQKLVEASDVSPDTVFNSLDVQDENVVLLTAGSKTTANAELFTLINVSKHPEVRGKLYEEVDHWYPDDRPTDSGYLLNGMTYLQTCIDNVMRLVLGQATGSPRETGKFLTILGYHVKRGTTIFPNTQIVQRNEKLWAQVCR